MQQIDESKNFVVLEHKDVDTLIRVLDTTTDESNRTEKETSAFNKLHLIVAAMRFPCGVFVRLSFYDVQTLTALMDELVPLAHRSQAEGDAYTKLQQIAKYQQDKYQQENAKTQGPKPRVPRGMTEAEFQKTMLQQAGELPAA